MKNDTQGFASPFVLKTLSVLFLAGSLGLGTVWLRHQISTTANRTKSLQARLVETERLINSTRADVARAQDPGMLKLLNAQWKLGLVPPAPQQTATLDAQPVPYLAAKHNRELFDRADAGQGGMVGFEVAARPVVQATTVSFRGVSPARRSTGHANP